jgi:hypothetical protein
MTASVNHQLRELVRAGKPDSEIRAIIEPRLPPGCKLSNYTDSCVTSSGTSGYKQCWQISGCDDPANNGDPNCGDCQGG